MGATVMATVADIDAIQTAAYAEGRKDEAKDRAAATDTQAMQGLLLRAADMLIAYAELIRRDGATHVEEHHYLPNVEYVAIELRTKANATSDSFSLLQALLASSAGRDVFWKLSEGQGTDTEDGRVWLAARALFTCKPCAEVLDAEATGQAKPSCPHSDECHPGFCPCSDTRRAA